MAEKYELFYKGQLLGGSGGTSFTTDDTLTLKDGVLGVTLPARAVTSAEYAALSEEEKMAEVEYIITDDGDSGGSGSGPVQEVYSTEETRVGTWIDGKPVYKRTYQLEASQCLSETIILSFDFKLDQLINQSSIIRGKTSDAFRSLAMVSTSGTTGVETMTGNGYVLIIGNSNTSSPNTVKLKLPIASWAGILTLTIEYTKTTD